MHQALPRLKMARNKTNPMLTFVELSDQIITTSHANFGKTLPLLYP